MPSFLKLIPLICKFPKCNIFECMALHFIVLKVNGYACFSISGNLESGSVKTTHLDKLLFLFYFLVATLLWIASVWLVKPTTSVSPLLYIGDKMIWFTCYFAAHFGIVWNYINKNKVWLFYKSIFKVDQQLLSYGAKMNYTGAYLAMIGYSLSGLAFVLLLIVWHVQEVGFTLLAFVTFSYSHLSFTLLTTVFFTSGWIITSRLQALNRLIDDNMLKRSGTGIVQVKEVNSAQTVRQYMQIYDQLCDLTETVNYCHGGQVMVAVAGAFVYLLFFAFGIVLFINRDDPILDFSSASLLWFMFYMSNILLIVTIGSLVTQQGKHTSNLIDQAINSANNAEIIEMLRLFLMQLGHRSPTLTCGLFPFDWTLVYSIMATTTTYLIILIQFENARPI
ncbi:putative gustatory receptor 28a [Toxorhynchites rutilus septentrionalis]|uniref:putative gustatory receptor 28a n=1 Tax=Toxorhynchites rutilus septentrionalis TaxID=329112 RepID=UPI00247A5DA9|nr:putative gustatory receptor 28a [Toxorhynchites rutilus septentrionalis]